MVKKYLYGYSREEQCLCGPHRTSPIIYINLFVVILILVKLGHYFDVYIFSTTFDPILTELFQVFSVTFDFKSEVLPIGPTFFYFDNCLKYCSDILNFGNIFFFFGFLSI